MPDEYLLSPSDLARKLGTDLERGLESSEVKRRLEEYGFNELVDRGSKPAWRILLEQFSETMVIVLIVATVISALLGEYKDALVILVIVLLNALLGFRQEYQAERAMAALKKLAVPKVRVRRSGHVQEISARQLAPGDIVLLETGNLVPADCRLVESYNLRAQEAALTGESEPVSKNAEFQPDLARGNETTDLPLAERLNMVYMGTVITYGRGQAIVTATGMRTELGRIAELMQSTGQESTPLQRRLDQLGKGLALAALVLVGIVFGLGLLRGEDLQILFLTSIGMAVAAVPEGLPAVVTISLALGARRMLKRQALIRRLPAVEALGSVTVICSDKTGTLTENRMTVTVLDMAENRIDLTEEDISLPFRSVNSTCINQEPDAVQSATLKKHPALTLLLAGGALCNDAILECVAGSQAFRIVGDPTEGALLQAAACMGLLKETLEGIFPRKAEIPFDSERKRMTTVHSMPSTKADIPSALLPIWDWGGWMDIDKLNYMAFTKGAVDGLLEISNRVWVDNWIEPLDISWRKRIEAANEQLAKQGMRVLGIACRAVDTFSKKLQAIIDPDVGKIHLENDLIFIGLVGMIDPARPEVKNAVQTCRTARIRPIMITGDHPLTAGYIARQLEIIKDGMIVTGPELDRLTMPELEETVERVSVYARVSPQHKLNIVQALQNRSQIVAMTGDGVNDAPALKKADIGVAMGIIGTDVSKEAADIVLLDDNFATIVAAVREGRIIYDNIRKFIQYTLTSNAGEIWVMLLAPFLGMPLPLLPIQILWINLVTDGLPGLALSVELGERNVMHRLPYPPNENIFARGLGKNVLWIGLLMGLISLGVGYFYWRVGNPLWRTMTFTTLTLSEMGYVMAIRSQRESLFRMGAFSNPAMAGAVALTIGLQMLVVYVPFIQDLFKTMALSWGDLLIVLGLSTSLFWVVEIQKWFIRRNYNQDQDVQARQ